MGCMNLIFIGRKSQATLIFIGVAYCALFLRSGDRMLRKKMYFIVLVTLLAVFLTACASEEAQASPLIGAVAPDFTLDDAIGSQTSLSDFSGEPVLLFFHMAVG